MDLNDVTLIHAECINESDSVQTECSGGDGYHLAMTAAIVSTRSDVMTRADNVASATNVEDVIQFNNKHFDGLADKKKC